MTHTALVPGFGDALDGCAERDASIVQSARAAGWWRQLVRQRDASDQPSAVSCNRFGMAEGLLNYTRLTILTRRSSRPGASVFAG